MRALRIFVFFTLKAVSFVVANLVARDLHVQNTVLSPDGFSRSSVVILISFFSFAHLQAAPSTRIVRYLHRLFSETREINLS